MSQMLLIVAQEYQNRSYDYKSLLFYSTLGMLGKGRTSCGLANLNNNSVLQFACQNTDAVLDMYSTLDWRISLSNVGDGSLTCDQYSLVSFEKLPGYQNLKNGSFLGTPVAARIVIQQRS